MTLKQQRNQKGFTIIEVLIVLAIAGLIMLIVFLAVPALQRNSRNTQSRNDAASILGGAQEQITNSNGAVPTASVSSTAGSVAETIFKNAKTQNITKLTITASLSAVTPAISDATLVTGAKCGAISGATNTPTAGSTRQMVLIYAVEGSNGLLAQCQES